MRVKRYVASWVATYRAAVCVCLYVYVYAITLVLHPMGLDFAPRIIPNRLSLVLFNYVKEGGQITNTS